jgi:hypothetical protein
LLNVVSGSLGLIFATTLWTTFMFSFDDDEIPSSVGIAGDGFRINYRDGTYVGFEWAKVNNMERPKGYKEKSQRGRFSLNFTFDAWKEMSIDNLSAEKASRLYDAYSNRNLRSSGASSR